MATGVLEATFNIDINIIEKDGKLAFIMKMLSSDTNELIKEFDITKELLTSLFLIE